MDEILQEIRELVATRVAEGFDSDDEIVEQVTEAVEDEHKRDGLRPHVGRITAELVEEHRRREARWVGPTDCDRLDAAFADLEQRGIVARQNFSCCGTCGHVDIWEEIAEARQDHEVSGYAFYHMQDTECAAAGGDLYVAYGSVEESRDATVRIGYAIVDALTRAGLQVEWDGSPRTRILVVGLDWKRRRRNREVSGDVRGDLRG